jgi:hypothetical protein
VSENCKFKSTNTFIDNVLSRSKNLDGKKICDLPKHGQWPTSNIRQFCSTLWTQAASISKSA